MGQDKYTITLTLEKRVPIHKKILVYVDASSEDEAHQKAIHAYEKNPTAYVKDPSFKLLSKDLKDSKAQRHVKL